MKNILLIICFIFAFGDCALCYTNYYNPTYTYRNTYNPYRNPLNYSRYQNNLNNKKAIRKIQQRKKLNKIRKIQNRLSTVINNINHSNGTLTGYSVPINPNITPNINPISPTIFNKHKLNSPTCNNDLFSAPSNDSAYFSDGRYYDINRDFQTKTGVTIIYD